MHIVAVKQVAHTVLYLHPFLSKSFLSSYFVTIYVFCFVWKQRLDAALIFFVIQKLRVTFL